MKNVVATFGTVLLLTAGVALANITVEDADGNGSYSMEELAVAYPDMTDDLFAEIDTDGDGSVSMEELTAAQEAALIAS